MEEIEQQIGRKATKNVKDVFELAGSIILAAVTEAYFAPLNPETWVQNWGIGIIFFLTFAILYCLPISRKYKIMKKIVKKFFFFMMIFGLIWIFIDWADFILFMRGGKAV